MQPVKSRKPDPPGDFIRDAMDKWKSGIAIADVRTGDPENKAREISRTLSRKNISIYDLSRPENTAYFPFFNLLRDLERENPRCIESLIAEPGRIYSLHRELFLAYLADRDLVREELIVQEEVAYEARKFREDMKNLLEAVTEKKPLVLILKHLPLISFSTAELIRDLVNEKGKINLFILFLSEEGYLLSSQKRIQMVSDFRNFVEEKGDAWRNSGIVKYEVPSPVHIREKDASRTIRDLHLGLEFLALDDTEELLELILDNNQTETDYELLFINGKLSYLKEDWNMALLHFSDLKDKSGIPVERKCRAMLYLAASYIRKNCIAEAEQICKELESIPLMRSDRRGRFYLLHIRLLILQQEFSTSYKPSDDFLKDIVELGTSLGYRNTLAFWLTAPFNLNYIHRKDQILRYQNQAIKIASALGNEFRLAALYHTKSLFFLWQRSPAGYKGGLKLLKKSEEIRKRLNHRRELVNLYNGRGFLFYQYGDYQEALEEFRKALSLIEELNDDLEYALSLFNIARTYFTVSRYDVAAQFLDCIMLQLEILGEENIPFQSAMEVHSIQLICNIRCGNRFKAEELKSKITRGVIKIDPDRDTDRFLRDWALGLCLEQEGDNFKARSTLEKALALSDAAGENSMIPSYRHALLLHCSNSPLWDDAEKANFKKTGAECAREQKNTYFTSQYAGETILLEKITPDINAIVTRTKKNNEINSLHVRIRNIDFLNSFFSVVSESEDHEELFRKAFGILEIHFLIREPVFFAVDNSQWSKLYGTSDWHDSTSTMGKIREKLIKSKRITILVDDEDRKYHIVGMPSIRNRTIEAVIIARIERDRYRKFSDQVPVFEMALKTFFQGHRRITAREHLSILAHTDPLTGLYNRKAFWNEVNMELERNRRHHHDGLPGISVIYLDLDNFKYYNDRFGHQRGDKILQDFSGLMVKMFRTTDIISRFGGDEFVIMLPETSEKQAVQICRRFIESFTMDYLAELHSEPEIGDIPREKVLSCSIGIGEYSAGEENFESFLGRVDMLLYEVKRAGKNGIKSMSGF